MNEICQGKYCLVVDDVRASRELVKAWVTELGFDCTTAVNGEEAWTSILRQCPDVVFTDLGMPQRSGLDLLYSLRSHPSPTLQTLPVVVISGLVDDRLESIVDDLGGSCLLTKPLEKNGVQATARRVIANGPCPREPKIPEGFTLEPCNRISPTLRRLVSEIRSL